MQDIFEKIKERLGKEHKLAEEDAERYDKGNSNHFKYAKARGYVNAMEVAIEIVNQVAEEYKNQHVSRGACKLVAWERDIAIEMLRELGNKLGQKIDEEFCEWRNNGIADEWNPSCEKGTYNVFGVAWFKRCPYCGKEIKVVE